MVVPATLCYPCHLYTSTSGEGLWWKTQQALDFPELLVTPGAMENDPGVGESWVPGILGFSLLFSFPLSSNLKLQCKIQDQEPLCSQPQLPTVDQLPLDGRTCGL